MTYGGNITVLDEEGNIVFERELNEDEIVEALLAAIPDEETKQEVDDVEEEPRAKSRRKCGACGKPGHSRRTCGDTPTTSHSSGKPCCGSKGKRHKKECPGTENTDEDEDYDAAGEKQARLTERQWRNVKVFQNTEGWTALQVAGEMALQLADVNAAFVSATYDAYIKLRRR